jgi:hypothetical protein
MTAHADRPGGRELLLGDAWRLTSYGNPAAESGVIVIV